MPVLSLRTALAALPPPRNEFDIAVPEDEPEEAEVIGRRDRRDKRRHLKIDDVNRRIAEQKRLFFVSVEDEKMRRAIELVKKEMSLMVRFTHTGHL